MLKRRASVSLITAQQAPRGMIRQPAELVDGHETYSARASL